MSQEKLESSILSTLLTIPNAVQDSIEIGLESKFFQDQVHGQIFLAILETGKSKVEPEKILRNYPNLSARVQKLYLEFDDLRGYDFEDRIIDLMGLALKRDLAIALVDSSRKTKQIDVRGKSRDEILDTVLEPIEEIMFSVPAGQNLITYVNESDEYISNIESDFENKTMEGIQTGKQEIDDIIGGFMPGRFYVIGARPGHGKTTLACIWAINAALAKHHTLFVTMEMTPEEIRDKHVSYLGKCDYQALATRQMDNVDLDRFMIGARKTHTEYMHVLDLGGGSFEKLIRRIKFQHAKGMLDIVFVDYLTLLTVENKKFQSRRLEISHMTMEFKKLSQTLKIPVVVMSQLNREATGLPEVSQLKESGSIEQDADVVFLLFKGSDDRPDADINKMQPCIIIGKNRHGKTGWVRANYKMETATIE